ncbi:hypothetical protein BS47DRAFT_1317336 [Hydnum rufescens UP504]|uniref:Peptidyl-tRNA hydrolase n=1 Tax=Hydnum rufescens UP504 TaxID=1448309 RepID=A0A9P6AX86_9AGAM|nr:hypothetical protein BS47DRAFT_1317336 [Hydnum rufescens UP504]
MGVRVPSILVVGLGNHTHPYTRHSVGQLLIASFAARLGVKLREDSSLKSWIAQKEVDIIPPYPKGHTPKRDVLPLPAKRINIILVKPKLLMNISGRAVALALKAHIPHPEMPNPVIVIHDSLSHRPFSVHARFGGTSNGHNGVADVISRLNGPGFHRIRIGIGRPSSSAPYVGYVMEPLDKAEREWWGGPGEGVEKAWSAVEEIALQFAVPVQLTSN